MFLVKVRRGIGMAIRNLWLHKLRSFLSVLGIIIGTCAVITLMAFGEGNMQDALEEIKRQGMTNIIVMSVKPPEDATSQRRSFIANYGLTDQDHRRMAETLSGTVVATLPMRIFRGELRPTTESRMYEGRIVGTTPRHAVVYKLEKFLAAGRFLSEEDEDPVPKNVVVLGSEVASELFPGEDPINKTIKIAGKDRAFIVIGVLKDRMPSTSGADIEKLNGDIYIPLKSCRALLGEIFFIRTTGSRGAEKVALNQVVLTVDEKGDTNEVRDRVRNTADIVRWQLNNYHDRKDWDIRIPLDKLEQAESTRDRYLVLLAVIACISLLVGGIGIMNIMLSTVTERIREIGIRRALGAKKRNILLQFLMEAVVQTTLGGLLGVGLGIVFVYTVPWLAFQIHHLCVDMSWVWLAKQIPERVPAAMNDWSYIAFPISILVGVLSGIYPAYRAAQLDPIEALRHE
jgi:putative ABC transport system permease protein